MSQETHWKVSSMDGKYCGYFEAKALPGGQEMDLITQEHGSVTCKVVNGPIPAEPPVNTELRV